MYKYLTVCFYYEYVLVQVSLLVQYILVLSYLYNEYLVLVSHTSTRILVLYCVVAVLSTPLLVQVLYSSRLQVLYVEYSMSRLEELSVD